MKKRIVTLLRTLCLLLCACMLQSCAHSDPLYVQRQETQQNIQQTAAPVEDWPSNITVADGFTLPGDTRPLEYSIHRTASLINIDDLFKVLLEGEDIAWNDSAMDWQKPENVYSEQYGYSEVRDLIQSWSPTPQPQQTLMPNPTPRSHEEREVLKQRRNMGTSEEDGIFASDSPQQWDAYEYGGSILFTMTKNKHYFTMYAYNESQKLTYSDSSVYAYYDELSDELGLLGEVLPIDMTCDQTFLYCKKALATFLPTEYLQYSDFAQVCRSMPTEREQKEQPIHSYTFIHRYDNDIPIYGTSWDQRDEGIRIWLCNPSIVQFSASWHEYEASQERITPISAKRAIEALANMMPLYQQIKQVELCYHNGKDLDTSTEEYTLKWKIVTDRLTAYVDAKTAQVYCDDAVFYRSLVDDLYSYTEAEAEMEIVTGDA